MLLDICQWLCGRQSSRLFPSRELLFRFHRAHLVSEGCITRKTGGSQGWQAYEQLVSRSGGNARQSRAVDVFSYGLLLHYCLTGGRHPFGKRWERDMNISQVCLVVLFCPFGAEELIVPIRKLVTSCCTLRTLHTIWKVVVKRASL